MPDAYLELINPLWNTAELRGVITEIRRETHDTATIVIRPSRPWPGHEPGQYLRLGVEIDGIGAIENDVVQERIAVDRALAAFGGPS